MSTVQESALPSPRSAAALMSAIGSIAALAAGSSSRRAGPSGGPACAPGEPVPSPGLRSAFLATAACAIASMTGTMVECPGDSDFDSTIDASQQLYSEFREDCAK